MVKILLMRHAESHYNALQSKWAKDHNEDPHFEHIPNRWIVNDQIIDAVLSPLGVDQAKKSTEVLNKYPNIKTVWVSPLRRAFDTMKFAFQDYQGNHPHKVPHSP